MCNRRKYVRFISLVLLFFYMVVLIYVVLFAEMFGRSEVSAGYNYNLVPFREIMRFLNNINQLGWKAVIVNLLGNVVAFIPFGLFLPIVFRYHFNWLTISILTFDLSLSIELMQLITKVGSFDVDDLILNVFGGLVGYGICCIWDKIEGKHFDGVL